MDLVNMASDGFDFYRNFQEAHPHIGSMLTAEAVFVTGDAVSQLITDRSIDKRKIGYTATLAPIYGLCLDGLLETGELVGKFISENPLAKAALGPNLWGNFFNTIFFANNTIGERNNYSIPKLARHYKKLAFGDNFEKKRRSFWTRFKEDYISNIPGREFLYTTTATFSLWNVFQYLNYAYVEEHMRTPATLAAAFVWTGVLSLWSLRGRRKIVANSVDS